MFKTILYLVLLLLFFVLIYIIIEPFFKFKFAKKIRFNPYDKIKYQLFLAVKKRLIPKKLQYITPLFLVVIMVLIYIISFLIFNMYLKIISTSLIISIPFCLIPIIVIKTLINKEKNKINAILPMYVVNLKNHIVEDNNIIKAIQDTSVQEPLLKYINVFNNNIKRGINVIEAFELLKKEVGVKNFTSLINACESCYLNGGDFSKILEQYIDIITKENTQKEASKEKAYSDILTLIVMVVINIFVIVGFVLSNREYAAIIRETVVGRAILSFNAISYLLIAYITSKIYKEE